MSKPVQTMSKPKRIKVDMENCDFFPINDLPNEILYFVFKFLTTEERLDASLVHKKWLEMLNWREFMKDVVLKLEYCTISPESPTWNMLMESQRTFLHLELGKDVVVNAASNELWKTVGKSIESIIYYSPKKCGKDFFLNFPVLKEIIADSWQEMIRLYIPDTVEKIHIDSRIPIAELKNKFLKDPKFQQLKMLTSKQVVLDLSTDFPSKSLKDYPELISQEIKTMCENFACNTFVPNITIKPINLLLEGKIIDICDVLSFSGCFNNYRGTLFRETNVEKLKNLQSLNKVEMFYIPIENLCFFTHEEFVNLSVKKFCVYAADEEDGYLEPCLSCIANLQKCFPNLESLKINVVTKLQLFTEAFKNSLKELSIKVNDYTMGLQISLPHLQKLKIEFDDCMSFESLNWDPMPKLKICEMLNGFFDYAEYELILKLCPGVTEATLEGDICSDDFTFVSESWLNLKKLILHPPHHSKDEKEIREKFKKLKVLKFL